MMKHKTVIKMMKYCHFSAGIYATRPHAVLMTMAPMKPKMIAFLRPMHCPVLAYSGVNKRPPIKEAVTAKPYM